MEAASPWRINRTMQDVLFDHQCPNSVVLNHSQDDWEALAEARHLNATRGLLGIYDNLQWCFKGNLHTPGFLKRIGKGQFVIDIGLGYDAKETRDAVKNGFTVFAFEMLPGNIKEIQKVVSGDSRFHFVELRKEGDQWVMPELPKPTGNTGLAYIINAAVSDEEMTVMFSNKQTHSLIESVDTGRGEGKPVPVLPLHKLLPSWLPHVDYLKIDTQGHELKVLRGCLKLFEEARCRYISFEFSPLLMRHAKSGDPLVLLKLLPSMGALCYTASAPHEHLRPGAAWPLEEWFRLLETGSWLGYKGIVKGGFGAWVDLLCTWPVTTLRNPKTTAKWTANRTVRELMLDHQCPDKVKYNLSEDDRSALERTRMSSAEMGRFGIFDDLQVCFERNSKMPGFLEKSGAGQFVIDIGVGWEAKEMRLAVQNGFTVFAFEMLPGNIQEMKELVIGDSRFHFVELRKDGDRWVLPELPKATGSTGIAYVINAAVWDEETTVTFPESLKRSHTESVTTGRNEGRPIPVLPLHKLLPKWLPHVDYMRIETQGHELKVLRGCERVLREPHSRYIQFVFAPWLIKRAQTGDLMELLRFLPGMGALCYTASSPKLHLRAGAPWPLRDWLKLLDEGNFTGYNRPVGMKDHYKMWMYGPWVDILCYWPITSSSLEEPTTSQSSFGLEVTPPGEQNLQQVLLQKPPMTQPQALFANSMSVWAGVLPLIFGWCILVALRCLRSCR